MKKVPVLSSPLHGFCCQRGELWLSDAECENLSAFLQSYGFCFSLDPSSETGPNIKRQKTTSTSGTVSHYSLQNQSEMDTPKPSGKKNDLANRCTASVYEKRRRSYSSKESSMITCSNTKIIRDESFKPESRESCNTVQKTAIYTGAATRSRRSAHPTRMTQRCRRRVLSGDWVDACLHVTELLENEPSARWFLTPVDISSQSPSDYLSKISCPMDFQTVKQKLTHRMYSHPFRWQEDIRTIFYNTFTLYEPGHLIWSSACYLAGLFERLCRENEGVNPYAVYSNGSPVKSQASQYGKKFSVLNQKCVRMRGPSHSSHAVSDTSSPSEEFDSRVNNMFSKSTKIVLEPAKLRELLEKAASVSQQGTCKDSEVSEATQEYDQEVCCGKGKMNYYDPHMSQVNSIRGGQNITASPCSASRGTKTLKQYDSSCPPLLKSTLPKPPPPPYITTMVPGDRIPSIIHQRLVSSQFRQLDIHLRFAALQLVKDDLGINPEVSASDPDFKLDLEILSFLKRKQLLTYLRTLNTFQRKKIEEGYSVTLATYTNCSPHPTTPDRSSISSGKHGDFPTHLRTPKETTSPALKQSIHLSYRPTMFIPNSATRVQHSSTSSAYSSSSYSREDDVMNNSETSGSLEDSCENHEHQPSGQSSCDSPLEEHNLPSSGENQLASFRETPLTLSAAFDEEPCEPIDSNVYRISQDTSSGGTDMEVIPATEQGSSRLHIMLSATQTPNQQNNPAESSLHSCHLTSSEPGDFSPDKDYDSTSQDIFQYRNAIDSSVIHDAYDAQFQDKMTLPENLNYSTSKHTFEQTQFLDSDLNQWNTSINSKKVSSVWGEWKAKIIQQNIQKCIGDEVNRALLDNACCRDLERAAELADAQI